MVVKIYRGMFVYGFMNGTLIEVALDPGSHHHAWHAVINHAMRAESITIKLIAACART